MRTISRRQVLGTAGVAAGEGLVCGLPGATQEEVSSDPPAWRYVELDPASVVKRANELFPEGGCMYALFGSIVQSLAESVGEPYASFPYRMMRYGEGGIGGWGSICGALNGAAAIIGLLYQEKDKKRKAQLIDEIFSYYEATEFPVPATEGEEVARSRSDSVLCHVSVGKWCQASGYKAFSPEKKKRCRQMTLDVLTKTVEVLNAQLKGPSAPSQLAPPTRSCLFCHGKPARADSMGKMSCDPCHVMPDNHGE